MVDTLTAAGVEHVYWVTLREVKPQYISGGAWRQIQPYYWYFPDVNALLEQRSSGTPTCTWSTGPRSPTSRASPTTRST